MVTLLRYTGFSLKFMLIALGFGIGAPPPQGQTISFLRQFSTPGMDRTTAVAADASGIYVFGNRPASQAGLSSAGVRKYDSGGNELWTREVSVPAGGSVTFISAAAHASGVYVAGLGNTGQLFVSKYSADGNELWTRQSAFFGPGGLAVDATGVYVAGRDFPPDFSYLRKYSPDGVELWTSRFGNRQSPANPHAVAVDATGVYVFGIAFGAGSFVRKWDSRGNELWIRQLDPSAVLSALAAADPTGFYVAAIERRGFFLRKYDSDGSELWSRQVAASSMFNLSGTGPAGGVAADATGVYVVGTNGSLGEPALPGQCRSGSGGDFFVRKYDPDGAEQWMREFGTADAAWASGVALDTSGVYVAGQEGTAMVRDDWELFDVFQTANPAIGAFLARFEKSPAVVPASGPLIFPGCVVNAASYVGGGVAPGEIVTLFGSAMGPAELAPWRLTEDGRLATTLADTRILFNGVPAPLLYVSEKQSSAIVPYAMAGWTPVDVQVEYQGVLSEAVTAPVLASRPGIFSLDRSGQGQGAILNEDGTLNSPSNPAVRGSIISIFGTGGGEAAPGLVDGQIVKDILPTTSLAVSVFFDIGLSLNEGGVPSKPGEVLYAGGVPGHVWGLLQVKVRVPSNAVAKGDAVPFALVIGAHWEVFQITIALR